MDRRCTNCGSSWPQKLRLPAARIYCELCLAEKRARREALDKERLTRSIPAMEARIGASTAEWRAHWNTLTQEEQRAEQEAARKELWG